MHCFALTNFIARTNTANRIDLERAREAFKSYSEPSRSKPEGCGLVVTFKNLEATSNNVGLEISPSHCTIYESGGHGLPGLRGPCFLRVGNVSPDTTFGATTLNFHVYPSVNCPT